jgi:hypothetical protein
MVDDFTKTSHQNLPTKMLWNSSTASLGPSPGCIGKAVDAERKITDCSIFNQPQYLLWPLALDPRVEASGLAIGKCRAQYENVLSC